MSHFAANVAAAKADLEEAESELSAATEALTGLAPQHADADDRRSNRQTSNQQSCASTNNNRDTDQVHDARIVKNAAQDKKERTTVAHESAQEELEDWKLARQVVVQAGVSRSRQGLRQARIRLFP